MIKYIYFLVTICVISSCYQTEEIDSELLNKLIKFNILNDNQYADGVSDITVNVLLPDSINSIKSNNVIFIIERGKTDTVAVPITSQLIQDRILKVGTIKLYSNEPISIHILSQIEILGKLYSIDTVIAFKTAFPTRIKNEVDVLTIDTNSFDSKLTITSRLYRDLGQPSFNIPVKTFILDSNYVISEAIFHNYNPIAEDGKVCQNTIVMGESKYIGKQYIVSTSLNDSGEEISDTITFYSK